MALDREYKIGASSRRCQACARVMAVGDEYFSAVVETQDEEVLVRRDFCPACWSPQGAAYFSFWKTRVPQPDAARTSGPRLVDLGRLMQLFEHLADAAEEAAHRFRYVLALVLMRKRRLKLVESRRLAGGRGEELTLREPGTDRRHVVSCTSISEDEIRGVADRLRDILDMPDTWEQLEVGSETPVCEPPAPVADASDSFADAPAPDEPDSDEPDAPEAPHA